MNFLRLALITLVLVALATGAYFAAGAFFVSDLGPPPAVTEKLPETNELYPDIVPLPVMDLKVNDLEDGRTLLYFSTTYYNQGEGPLELRADPKTAGVRADIERDVYQRVYHRDGTYSEHVVGNFLWHQEHLHYHYTDFITYDLEAIDAPPSVDLSGKLIKATYCLRDISKVDLELKNRVAEAGYEICGKELQGVSVGWGDTYYWDYPAQNLDITGLASGTYKFTQITNPALRLKESRYSNNTSTVIFKLDMEAKTVTLISQEPAQVPDVEHIHLEDPFGVEYTR